MVRIDYNMNMNQDQSGAMEGKMLASTDSRRQSVLPAVALGVFVRQRKDFSSFEHIFM